MVMMKSTQGEFPPLPPSDESSSFLPERRRHNREFTIARTFKAPRELVFAAWTEQQHLKQWFGPKGFTIPISHLNLVPNGAFHYCLRASNGVEMWGKWIFREIVPPERIVFVNTFSNKHGNLTRHPYVPNWPLEMLTTSTFTEDNGKTTIRLQWTPHNANAAEQRTFDTMHEAMAQGWTGTFDQLDDYLITL
jgi:uncharacterized protein YndB with AHSA1/START domain